MIKRVVGSVAHLLYRLWQAPLLQPQAQQQAPLAPLEQEAVRLAAELVRQQEEYGVKARNVDYLERELGRLRAVRAGCCASSGGTNGRPLYCMHVYTSVHDPAPLSRRTNKPITPLYRTCRPRP